MNYDPRIHTYRHGARGDQLLIKIRRLHDQPRIQSLMDQHQVEMANAIDQIGEGRD